MRRIPACLAALALLLCALPALAGLDGRWTFSYRTPDGVAVAVPVFIEDEAGAFEANATYHLHGHEITDMIEGTVEPSGRVEFNVVREGVILPHRGQLSENGRVIRGWYSEPAGPGTFVLDRGPMAAEYPVLTGRWAYVFQEPGEPEQEAACTLESVRQGRFSGTLRHQGTAVGGRIEGTVDRQGRVRFTLREAGRTITHAGTVADDAASIAGTWHSDWSSGSFTMNRN